MAKKIMELLKGKTFDELVKIYEGFTRKEHNMTIETAIIDRMIEVDEARFLEWEQAQ